MPQRLYRSCSVDIFSSSFFYSRFVKPPKSANWRSIGAIGVSARQNTIVRGVNHRAITRLPCDYRALPLQFYVSTSVAWASRHRGTRLPAKSGYRLCRIVFICRNRARTESRSPPCTRRCVVGGLQVARLAREIWEGQQRHRDIEWDIEREISRATALWPRVNTITACKVRTPRVHDRSSSFSLGSSLPSPSRTPILPSSSPPPLFRTLCPFRTRTPTQIFTRRWRSNESESRVRAFFAFGKVCRCPSLSLWLLPSVCALRSIWCVTVFPQEHCRRGTLSYFRRSARTYISYVRKCSGARLLGWHSRVIAGSYESPVTLLHFLATVATAAFVYSLQ